VGGIPINIDPTLLQLGPVAITWHGLFTAVGTLVGIWLAVRWATVAGYVEDDVITTAMWGVIGAIIGARLFHVADQWSYYARDPVSIVRINEGGLAIWGVILGGPLAGGIYAWRRGMNVAKLADIASPALVFGMVIGRIGDVMNGEHHGVHVPTGWPLAVVYTNPNTLGEVGIPVHPAAGYELVLDLAIFAVLVWLARGFVRGVRGIRFNWEPRYPRDGMLFWIFLLLYSVARFFVQIYRLDTPFALGISQAQLVSVIAAMVAIWALAYQAARARRPSAAPEEEPAAEAAPAEVTPTPDTASEAPTSP
jgi:prolipoprotein diacylglyceryl transferase